MEVLAIALKLVLLICVAVAAYIVADMIWFRNRQVAAENPEAAEARAGGILFVKSDKTYYKMPSGVIRKIADYRMDLRPGSPDMQRFTAIMNQAAEEHAQEVAETKMAADKAMRDVAKDEAANVQ